MSLPLSMKKETAEQVFQCVMAFFSRYTNFMYRVISTARDFQEIYIVKSSLLSYWARIITRARSAVMRGHGSRYYAGTGVSCLGTPEL